jgi:hypothetical protein
LPRPRRSMLSVKPRNALPDTEHHADFRSFYRIGCLPFGFVLRVSNIGVTKLSSAPWCHFLRDRKAVRSMTWPVTRRWGDTTVRHWLSFWMSSRADFPCRRRRWIGLKPKANALRGDANDGAPQYRTAPEIPMPFKCNQFLKDYCENVLCGPAAQGGRLERSLKRRMAGSYTT